MIQDIPRYERILDKVAGSLNENITEWMYRMEGTLAASVPVVPSRLSGTRNTVPGRMHVTYKSKPHNKDKIMREMIRRMS